MKKIILSIAVLAITSCSSMTTLYDQETHVIIEDVHRAKPNKGGHKYEVEAWQFVPVMKGFKILTNKRYQIGEKYNLNSLKKIE